MPFPRSDGLSIIPLDLGDSFLANLCGDIINKSVGIAVKDPRVAYVVGFEDEGVGIGHDRWGVKLKLGGEFAF